MTDQVGQQRSETTQPKPTATPKSIFSRTVSVTLIRSGIVVGFFLAWEFASGRWIEPFLISSPSRIFTSLFSGFSSGDLLQHTWVTFLEVAIGFPIGAITGIALGYGFGRSRLLAEVFEPIIIALNGIPRTALAPLFIVWLGIGLWSKVGVVFLLTFFLNFF
ncbi:MAG TPA: ABC transporter permease, partial [Candidatus Binatia bacterium]|nr:ABC transporter permease [Candidatus Binatia bacterium]